MSNESVVELRVPDIGDFKNVAVIELLVGVGDTLAVEQPVLVLESDKATLEVPSNQAGTVVELIAKLGDKLSQGDLIARVATNTPTQQSTSAPPPTPPPAAPLPPKVPLQSPAAAIPFVDEPPSTPPPPQVSGALPHASPSIRLFARELGVDLAKVRGTGPKGRILRSDVQQFVKSTLQSAPTAPSSTGIPPIPAVDFSKFGDIETKPLARIRKLSASHLHRSWLNVPLVTQFDEADITELDAFRRDSANDAKKKGLKLTMLAFLLKASATTLRQFPELNASLAPDGESLILKKYVHIGVAVDTPNGLVVPVIRDVDAKGIFQLAGELGALSEKARMGKLSPAEMQGGCFSISSLGGIGGTAFTPLVNSPEVAILGVSKGQMKPVWDGSVFQPRLMLPLSLSYDHRVIDGAQAARITSFLAELLSDIRRVLL